jgi:hypothetical protein
MVRPINKGIRHVYRSTWDFEKPREFMQSAATHNQTSIEYKALMLSAIICYARPFSGNEIGKDPPADPKLSGIDVQALPAADFALHERIVTVRNKAVAARVAGVDRSSTKTGEDRRVELSPRALFVLTRHLTLLAVGKPLSFRARRLSSSKPAIPFKAHMWRGCSCMQPDVIFRTDWRRERDYSARSASPLRGRPSGVNTTGCGQLLNTPDRLKT